MWHRFRMPAVNPSGMSEGAGGGRKNLQARPIYYISGGKRRGQIASLPGTSNGWTGNLRKQIGCRQGREERCGTKQGNGNRFGNVILASQVHRTRFQIFHYIVRLCSVAHSTCLSECLARTRFACLRAPRPEAGTT